MTIIDKLRELEAKATPGEWRMNDQTRSGWMDNSVYLLCVDAQDGHNKAKFYGSDDQQRANASLIAAMRNALPELLRVAEAAKHAREVQSWGQVPRQVHEGEANQELDAALAALEVPHA